MSGAGVTRAGLAAAGSSARRRRDALVVGLGSPHGDDRVGWEAVGQLGRHVDRDVALLSSPVELFDHLDGQQRLIVCDACCGLGPPGTWRRFDWPARQLPARSAASTHAIGLAETLQLAEALGQLPEQVAIYAVEIDRSNDGAKLTATVAAATAAVVDAICQECQVCMNER